jgi:hypothetical protein
MNAANAPRPAERRGSALEPLWPNRSDILVVFGKRLASSTIGDHIQPRRRPDEPAGRNL